MGKNQAYKAMQRSRVGSTSAGPEEIEDGMVDGSFHSPEWHAARLASLKTSHTVTWEEFRKKQKDEELKKGELEADKDKMMREYRALLDAEREKKLSHGRNHADKLKCKKDKDKSSRKHGSRKKKVCPPRNQILSPSLLVITRFPFAGLITMEAPSPTIHIPVDWSDASNSISSDSVTSPPPVSIICGPKNSGKTTFSRHLLNTLLLRYKKVAYLDTDVGQPEFTAPGCISLTVIDKITPDFTIPCMKTPERCYFFGDFSSKRDPELYKKCVRALYNHYKKECRSCENGNPNGPELPLIVNTSGWVKGIGYEILVDMLNYIPATHVVKINICAKNKNLPAGPFWLDDEDGDTFNLIEISSALRDSHNDSVLLQKEPHLIRDLRLMAYFRQCLSSDLSADTIKELANALVSHPPYQIPVSSVQIEHLHCQIPSTEILYSANASVVGLAVSSKKGDDCLPICVGLGIIRGIDTNKNMLYVITPVPQSILESVDLLLQGFIQLPTGLLQVQGCRSPYMSANVLPTS